MATGAASRHSERAESTQPDTPASRGFQEENSPHVLTVIGLAQPSVKRCCKCDLD